MKLTYEKALERVREARRKLSKHQHEADYWNAELEHRLKVFRRVLRCYPDQKAQFEERWIWKRWDGLLKRLASS